MKKTKKVGAGEFKAKCLKLMDEVQATKVPLIVTKHGRPVVTVMPFLGESDFPLGYMKDRIVVHGDIVGPAGEKWDAESE